MPPAVGTVVRVRVILTGEERTGVATEIDENTGIISVRVGSFGYSFCAECGVWAPIHGVMLVCSTATDEIIGSPHPQTEQAQAADSSDFYLSVDCS
jgi:hypothetical protein